MPGAAVDKARGETPRLACPEPGCRGVLRLQRSLLYGLFYGCEMPDCTGRHSAHQATGEPMGTPATKEVRAARIRAHEAFDTLWKKRSPWQKAAPPMKRTAAYAWMQRALNLSKDAAHIGLFTVDQCEALIVAVKAASQKAG